MTIIEAHPTLEFPLPQLTDEQFLSVCHHEAGHAVVAGLLGFHVHSITVDPHPLDGGWGMGGVEWGPTDEDYHPVEVAAVAIAGALAEIRHGGYTITNAPDWMVSGWIADYGFFNEHVSTPADVELAKSIAFHLVEQAWPEIQELASWLTTARTITCRDLAQRGGDTHE